MFKFGRRLLYLVTSMKPRSPVLGYNHNVRYAERLWHVQTEDSGVGNPHIFTHLFHDGTILATKRIDEIARGTFGFRLQPRQKRARKDGAMNMLIGQTGA